jgi:penicillin-binding protein 1B
LAAAAWRGRGWLAVVAVCFALAFTIYCWRTFQEIRGLMEETPVNQPTLIYSDSIIIRPGADIRDLQLTERLKRLSLPVEETPEETRHSWRWTPRGEPAPVASLDDPEATQPPPGASIEVRASEGKVTEVLVNGQTVIALALEPLLMARIAGTGKSIPDYVPLDRSPTVLKEAIISVEDQRFREHFGFDPRSLARAVWINFKNRSWTQGGSTITQQLVKNLLQSSQKNLYRKLRELILAIFIELRYDKDQILEKYLNEVYFGQVGTLEVHGVADAAQYFFSKPLEKLTIGEMAFLAGIIRGPAVYSPYRNKDRATARKNTVLQKLAEQHYIAQKELEDATGEKLVFAPPSQGRNTSPFYADFVKAQVIDELGDRISQEDLGREGLRIYTAMDPLLQRAAEVSAEQVTRELETKLGVKPPMRLESVLVSVDHARGLLRALVGGRSYGESTFNRVLNMKRPAGSTFKPFIYTAAFEKGVDSAGGRYSAAYMLNDGAFTHTYDGGQTWSPQNYDREFRGPLTLREAFINSINVPAAKVAIDIGPTAVVATAHKLGISTSLPAVPSIALGTVDVGAVELAQAYATIANKGLFKELTAVKYITDKSGGTLARFVPKEEQVVAPAVMELLWTLLRDVTKRGTARSMEALGYQRPAFGKTGTTSFYRDSWFAGFSAGLATIAWVGFDELKEGVPNPIKLTGTTAALPLWSSYARTVRPGPPREGEEPQYELLEKERINKNLGCGATPATNDDDIIEEYFIPGTAPDECP